MLRRGQEGQVIFRNYRKDGTAFDNLLFLYPVYVDGTLKFYLGSQFSMRPESLEIAALRRTDGLYRRLGEISRESNRVQIATRRAASDTVALMVRKWLATGRD